MIENVEISKKPLTEFVCGFMFSEDKQNVLLIEKDRPEWQAGKLNGIGGKIEKIDGFIPVDGDNNPAYTRQQSAMAREFKEEVGIETAPAYWELFAICEGSNSRIYNFRMFSNKIFEKKQVESEYPTIVPCEYIGFQNTVPNVNFLIPMALYTNEVFHIHCEIKGGSNVQSSS